MKFQNEICCKTCGCNRFIIKNISKKLNKNKEYLCSLKCILCNNNIKFDKKIKEVRIIRCEY